MSIGRVSAEPRAIDGTRLSGAIGETPSFSAISATFSGQSCSISRA